MLITEWPELGRYSISMLVLLAHVNVVLIIRLTTVGLLSLLLCLLVALIQSEFSNFPVQELLREEVRAVFRLTVANRYIVTPWFNHSLSLFEHSCNHQLRVIAAQKSVYGRLINGHIKHVI